MVDKKQVFDECVRELEDLIVWGNRMNPGVVGRQGWLVMNAVDGVGPRLRRIKQKLESLRAPSPKKEKAEA